ncbi:hypothetical protein GCM10027189_14290 [Rufibacter soli]
MSLLAFLPFFLASCEDECESTITYVVQEPVYMTKAELRSSVKVQAARELRKPGKIYAFGDYLFINEVQEGIHIIDNRNPAAPQILSFIAIAGNVDMAVKDNILYADNYIDLVAIDITNPKEVQLVKRVENVFDLYGYFNNMTSNTFLARFEEKTVTQPYSSDCNGNPSPWLWSFDARSSGINTFSSAGMPAGGASGKGGSMARFTVTGNHLYTVGTNSLQLFDIAQPTNPTKGQKITLPWGVETIFPYLDKLFIGSNNGMHIYDNSNPASPVHLSTYAHVRACDPVVVEGDLAWVTLRSGNACAGFTNQLELINISNPRSPQLVKTFPMQNPHGLGIDQSLLFLCEGAYGLKVFDIKDPLKLADNQLKHYKDQDAYDVIPLGLTLLMVGKDGLYQYDYRNPAQISLLSKIPVARLSN